MRHDEKKRNKILDTAKFIYYTGIGKNAVQEAETNWKNIIDITVKLCIIVANFIKVCSSLEQNCSKNGADGCHEYEKSAKQKRLHYRIK